MSKRHINEDSDVPNKVRRVSLFLTIFHIYGFSQKKWCCANLPWPNTLFQVSPANMVSSGNNAVPKEESEEIRKLKEQFAQLERKRAEEIVQLEKEKAENYEKIAKLEREKAEEAEKREEVERENAELKKKEAQVFHFIILILVLFSES